MPSQVGRNYYGFRYVGARHGPRNPIKVTGSAQVPSYLDAKRHLVATRLGRPLMVHVHDLLAGCGVVIEVGHSSNAFTAGDAKNLTCNVARFL